MEPLEDEFGDIIQKARTGLGLSEIDVCERVNISLKILEEIEAYKYVPSKEEVIVLAGILGLDATKLFYIAMRMWHPEDLHLGKLSDILIIDGTMGAYKVKGYLLFDESSGKAVAFDTGNSSKKVLHVLHERGLRLKYIFLTHSHSDHTGGLSEICRATGAGIGMPERESALGFEKEMGKDLFLVKDNSEYNVGRHTIRAISTPGHTIGSTCYITKNYCFSGDTLFAGSVGMSYGIDGYKNLLDSVRTRILTLNEDICVFPGHGPSSTIREEIMHNPFFKRKRGVYLMKESSNGINRGLTKKDIKE
ncbi:MAG: MBL fold metallo-hydrolase [Nitrospirae bacterium]|nr:MBL fold metallo-hydrolase [Nitrospirota bacterium]